MAKRQQTYIFAPAPTKRRGPGCLAFFFAILLAVAVLVLIVSTAMNRQVTLVTEKVPVLGLDKTFERFTVLHVSDLHASSLGYDADAWRAMLHGKSYQAVAMTGDMVGKTGDTGPLVALIETLKQVNAAAPIFLIAGDDDPDPIVTAPHGSPDALADWIAAAVEAGATYLDAPVAVQVGKRSVWFLPEYLYGVESAGMLSSLERQKQDMEATGVQYQVEGGTSYRALCYRLEAMGRTVEAQKQMKDTDLQIALTHVPLNAEYIRTMLSWADTQATFSFRKISLVLGGHYAGGQWKLPVVGALYVPEKGFFVPTAELEGMQRINSINQYITGGLGASDFYPLPGRLLNAPSAALLSFTAKIQ